MRGFLAVDLSREIKEKLCQCQSDLKKSGADVKWVDKNNFHITLAFLGDIEESTVEDIIVRLEKNIPSFPPPFHLNISGMGVFPNRNNPRVIWAGVIQGQSELKDISQLIKQQLEPLGFDFSKKFASHITLGRFRSNKNTKVLFDIADRFEFIYKDFIKGITFMESTLTKSGPEYNEIAYLKLKNNFS